MLYALTFIIVHIFCAFTDAAKSHIPESYRISRKEDALYKFKSDSRVLVSVVVVSAVYEFDIAVRKSTRNSEILVQIEKVYCSDVLHEPSDEDLELLKIPFILVLDSHGEWSHIIISSRDNMFTLDHKENLITSLIYNHTQVNDYLNGTNTTSTHLEETPFGTCPLHGKIMNENNVSSIYISTRKSLCSGISDYKNSKYDITPDSNLAIKMTFESNPIKFVKIEQTMQISMERQPRMRVRVKSSLEFLRFRSPSTDFNMNDVRIELTREEFEKKLATFKNLKDEEEEERNLKQDGRKAEDNNNNSDDYYDDD